MGQFIYRNIGLHFGGYRENSLPLSCHKGAGRHQSCGGLEIRTHFCPVCKDSTHPNIEYSHYPRIKRKVAKLIFSTTAFEPKWAAINYVDKQWEREERAGLGTSHLSTLLKISLLIREPKILSS